jgi:hypothetical protein
VSVTSCANATANMKVSACMRRFYFDCVDTRHRGLRCRRTALVTRPLHQRSFRPAVGLCKMDNASALLS